MKNRWPLRLFSCALFIASDPTFAAQIEVRSEGSKNSKPLSAKSPQHRLLGFTSIGFSARKLSEPSGSARRYPWKKSIVTTVFWIGEQPSGNNPVPNRIRALPSLRAKTDGSPSAKAIARLTRNGRTQDLSVPITGSTFLAMNVRGSISIPTGKTTPS